jgi:hypothetical protein
MPDGEQQSRIAPGGAWSSGSIVTGIRPERLVMITGGAADVALKKQGPGK